MTILCSGHKTENRSSVEATFQSAYRAIQVQSAKAHISSERRKWRSEVRALKKELHEREQVRMQCLKCIL